MSANGTGSISVSGGSSSVSTTNGVSKLSCGAGFVELTRITDSAVTFSVGGSPIEVPVGATSTVGRYQVTVLGIERGTAKFQMVPG